MQKTAVHATEKQLIAPRYMIQTSAHSAFFTPNANCSLCKALVAIYWMHFRVNLICIYIFCKQKYNNITLFITGRISASTSAYLMFINNFTVKSSSRNSQLLLRIKFPTKRVFRIFNIWKTNKMTLFCNLFIERPS